MSTKITVGYIQKLPEFSGMRLIAGDGGLGNAISSCTILDYEYEKSVKSKYTYIHFSEGQFIITSFLYAKDNEFLVLDAVKRLVERGCSGLAIRNVFRVPISGSVIRYADSKCFPIFILKDVSIYFEDIIRIISNLVARNESIRCMETYVDRLLRQSLNQDEILNTLLQINPSFCTEFCVLYFIHKDPLTFDQVVEITDLLSPLTTSYDSMFCYKNGVMLIQSKELFKPATVEEIAKKYLDALGTLAPDYYVGISNIHHNLLEIQSALNECIYAAMLNGNESTAFTAYKSLGVYQLLIPHATEQQFENYCKQYTSPLIDYDYENNTKLFLTAQQYYLCNGDIIATAASLSQHKNTIRYRIDKISKICNENLTEKSGYEKVSLAFKIYSCREILNRFRNLINAEAQLLQGGTHENRHLRLQGYVGEQRSEL